jgi:macrolide-specific efflux system membrane fusion protein
MSSRALCRRWFAMSGLEASMKLKILAIVALAVVGLGAAFVAMGGLPASASATTQYLTGAVTTGDVSDDVAATGTMASTASYGLAFGSPAHLAAATASSATSQTTWTVKDVKVAVGDTVKAGQTLATASTTDLQRDLANARSALNSAAIQLAIAQDSVDAATTTAQTRQATMSLNNAQTQVTNAHKTVNDLLDQIRLATLKSPIDGVVTTVAISKGLSAPSGDAIVIDSTTLQVTADVAETDVASISVGQLANVTVSAVSAQLTGKVTAIAPTAAAASTNGSVVSYPVTISVTGAPKTVRTGMSASITITIDSATNVLTVPSAALRGTAGNYSVLIMNATGEPTAQAVQVGLVTNTTAEIKSGLTEGQRVVTGVNTAQTGAPTTGNGFGGGLGGGFPVGGGGGGTRRGTGN